MIPPTRATEDVLGELAGTDAQPAPAARRPARAASGQPDGRAHGSSSWSTAHGSRTACAPEWPRSSTTPSGARAPASAELPDGAYAAEDVLEGGPGGRATTSTLRVSATIEGERLRLDFTGTDPQVEGNLNCPLSVTKSAAFFAVRVLTDPDAPPSAGRASARSR